MNIPNCIRVDRERNSRFNSHELREIKEYLEWRDGLRCNNEGCITNILPESQPNVILVVDHIDNNKKRHFHENLQILCKSCNIRKNPRGKARRKKKLNDVEIVCVNDLLTHKGCLEIELKLRYYKVFKEMLDDEMSLKFRINREIFIDNVSYITKASRETLLRYLKMETAELAPYKTTYDDRSKLYYIEWRKAQPKYSVFIKKFAK